MVILGIDPGYGTVGYGVIEKLGAKIVALDYGVIQTSKEDCFAKRLSHIDRGIRALIERFHPDEAAIEQLFFAKNVTTGLQVAEARGVIELAIYQQSVPLFQYKPNEIKLAITGWGKAEKRQMQEMVKTHLGLSKIPRPDDAADALAVALCHAHTNRFTGSFRIG